MQEKFLEWKLEKKDVKLVEFQVLQWSSQYCKLEMTPTAQSFFTGHSEHLGPLGEQIVAPSSMTAWLKSPGRVGDTILLALLQKALIVWLLDMSAPIFLILEIIQGFMKYQKLNRQCKSLEA